MSGVILKLFNQPVLYESIVDEKRVQYTSSDEEVCFEGELFRTFFNSNLK